jgi:hypothetical protein
MSFIGGMPKKNPHGRGLSSGRRPAEARRSDLNLSDVWAVSVDRRSAIEAERGSIGLRAVWHGKGRGHWRGHSLMLPSFVLEPSNGRMHRAGAAGYGAIRITNLGTVK